ncbi:YkgJ family cysteine cluster protein [Streptomyces werraensis]|uniref:YkgJ family cysteine cluster protein n=1 Tax=Streptomyces werraensis TaxID=68284 RepID=UPI003449C665
MELSEATAAVLRLAEMPARELDPEAVDALYTALPRMNCKGKCASACAAVPATPLERQRITARGHHWVDGERVVLADGRVAGTTCSALDQKSMRCRVYEDRPMVCRVWGLIKALECPWGCVPEGGHLDDLEGLRLVNAAAWFGGARGAVDPASWDALVARPEIVRQLLAHVEKPVKEPAVVQTVAARRAAR